MFIESFLCTTHCLSTGDTAVSGLSELVVQPTQTPGPGVLYSLSAKDGSYIFKWSKTMERIIFCDIENDMRSEFPCP